MPDGLLVVDKPRGPTSHDIVAEARRRFGVRGIGHAGTLDPMATGILVLLFGEGRKLSSYLTLDEKAYVAEVCFGTATDTFDAEGTVVESRVLGPGTLDRGRVEAALQAERERTEQVPPPVSSIKVGGERAHRLTRRGEAPVLLPRKIRVAKLTLLEADEKRISLELTVSKGYYVRSLARDLGEALGAPAHLSRLARTRSGAFTLDDAVRWPPDELPALTSVAEAVRRSLPCVELTQAGAAKARLGQRLSDEHFVVPPDGERPHAWLDPEGRVVALGERAVEGSRVLRGFRV
jgi:tRNA pseudouridine55 synthase